MTRKQFIESHGATCDNWQWSWSFVDHESRKIIFGAWDRYMKADATLILSPRWQVDHTGRRKAGYPQSREHIRLVEDEGYQLFTFPLIYSDERKDEHGEGPATIDGFTPELSPKQLEHRGDGWYAVEPTDAS